MALTLIDAAKQAIDGGEFKTGAIVRQYAESSPILERLRFRNIAGNAISYNREDTMPGIGFRGINEAFAESTGIINPQTETLTIAGGDLDVDRYLIQTMGDDIRGGQEMLKVRSLALSWTNTFINGDSAIQPREYDGLKKRLTGTQLVNAGSTSGGDVLSLNKLDELIDQVENPSALIMNKTMRRRLTAASRNTGVGGFITFNQDAFGRPLAFYADLPILLLDEDNEKNKILPFTEAAPAGGTAQCTSIYCVSMEEMMLEGIQNGSVDVRDLGELDSKPVLRTRVEWFAGIMIMNGRGAARLQGVKDGAVTA